MKLLLTSTGITNNSIREALEDLTGKPVADCKVVFIPTAAHGVPGDKSWLVHELKIAQDLEWKSFDILELTAVTSVQLRKRLEETDVIYVNGGNAYYLMNRMINSGMEKLLPELLNKKVYVSSSAGGIITSKYFPGNLAKVYGEESKLESDTIDHGLDLVDFVIKPHLNAAYFPGRTLEWFDEISPQIDAPFFAIDDNTAIKVVDGKVEVVSEGVWRKYNEA